MKNYFPHKYVLRAMAFAVLALAFTSISLPIIKEYNSDVYYEQIRLNKVAETGFNPGKVVFSLSEPHITTEALTTFILITLFISLIITKRIRLSFLWAFLVTIQLYAIVKSVTFLIKEEYIREEYFATTLLFEICFFVAMFAFCFWQASVICHFCYRKYHNEAFIK